MSLANGNPLMRLSHKEARGDGSLHHTLLCPACNLGNLSFVWNCVFTMHIDFTLTSSIGYTKAK
mgnify:CR=1